MGYAAYVLLIAISTKENLVIAKFSRIFICTVGCFYQANNTVCTIPVISSTEMTLTIIDMTVTATPATSGVNTAVVLGLDVCDYLLVYFLF